MSSASARGAGRTSRSGRGRRSGPRPVRHLELDVTRDCVLDCAYCFRRDKARASMSWETAKRAVDWFVEEGSGEAKRLTLWFFGGEPLLGFDLIREVVEYAEAAAARRGKRVHCGATTNAVLATEEVVAFWRAHGMSFNTSIDGCAEAHDRFRRFRDGRGSYAATAAGARRILAAFPRTTARCSVHPENAGLAYESVRSLLELGYERIPLIPIDDCAWPEESLARLGGELRKLSELYIERARAGRPIYLKHLDMALRGIANPLRRRGLCGAGRGMVLCDTEGRLWPCHRFPGYDREGRWVLGDVWSGLDEARRRPFVEFDARRLKADCARCAASGLCVSTCAAVNWAVNGDLYAPPAWRRRLYEMYAAEGRYVHAVLWGERNAWYLGRYYGGGGARPRVRWGPRVASAAWAASFGPCDPCDFCDAGCDPCEQCEDQCDDPCQNACETCEGCETCEPCESCDLTCEACETCQGPCDFCEQCDETCETCDSCEGCETCEAGCEACEAGCESCDAGCEPCDVCDGCDMCEVLVDTVGAGDEEEGCPGPAPPQGDPAASASAQAAHGESSDGPEGVTCPLPPQRCSTTNDGRKAS